MDGRTSPVGGASCWTTWSLALDSGRPPAPGSAGEEASAEVCYWFSCSRAGCTATTGSTFTVSPSSWAPGRHHKQRLHTCSAIAECPPSSERRVGRLPAVVLARRVFPHPGAVHCPQQVTNARTSAATDCSARHARHKLNTAAIRNLHQPRLLPGGRTGYF